MILIGLGSSLAFNGQEPTQIITKAIEALAAFCIVRARSRLYVSPAWPDAADPPFINAVVAVETALSPEALMAGLLALEAGFGRRRTGPNAPRTLDLDLLDYNGELRPEGAPGGLVLPHPGAAKRDFVLAPLLEVAPDWRHPATGLSGQALLAGIGQKAARPL